MSIILPMKLKIFLFFLVWLCAEYSLFSQKVSDSLTVKSVNQSTMIGIGKAYLTDTYLSPLEYSGIAFSLLRERINGTSLLDKKLLFQQKFLFQTAFTKNPSASASEYYGNIHYAINGLYPLLNTPDFRLFGAAGWDVALGGLYNARNSNNPGSLKVSTNINLSAQAFYRWRVFTFRWQLTTPVLGMFFSPEYGNSYYEIFSLGNDKGVVQFASLHNQLALQNYFTVDFPVKNITIRTGYLGNYYKTNVNNLMTKLLFHQFMVGFAVESLNFGGNKAKQHTWLHSVYY